jgi:hypothetical protein
VTVEGPGDIQGRRQGGGGCGGLKPPRNVGWGPTPGVMGGPRQRCRQGNGEWRVRGAVVGGVGWRVEKM